MTHEEELIKLKKKIRNQRKALRRLTRCYQLNTQMRMEAHCRMREGVHDRSALKRLYDESLNVNRALAGHLAGVGYRGVILSSIITSLVMYALFRLTGAL